jgi:hypothetical protein
MSLAKGKAGMFALGFFDYFIIAIIVSVFGGGAAAISVLRIRHESHAWKQK